MAGPLEKDYMLFFNSERNLTNNVRAEPAITHVQTKSIIANIFSVYLVSSVQITNRLHLEYKCSYDVFITFVKKWKYVLILLIILNT